MKRLNKLQINPEKVMNHKELVSLKGGTEILRCERSWIWGGDCVYQNDPAFACDDPSSIRLYCGFFCPGFNSAICVGPLY